MQSEAQEVTSEDLIQSELLRLGVELAASQAALLQAKRDAIRMGSEAVRFKKQLDAALKRIEELEDVRSGA